jgi:hypothetical protein
MRQVVNAFAIATCIAIAGWAALAARAQSGGVAVSFRNDLKIPLYVQGHTLVGNMPQKGMVHTVLPGKELTDNNVPAGQVRYYTVSDGNRPMVRYLHNFPVQVGQQDLKLAIRGLPPKVFLEKIP